MPEEVNIDELLDLKTDEERTQRLQVTVRLSFRPSVLLSVSCVFLSLQDIFHSCNNNNTEVRTTDWQLPAVQNHFYCILMLYLTKTDWKGEREGMKCSYRK